MELSEWDHNYTKKHLIEINYLLSYMNTKRLINKQSASKTLSGIKYIG